jgi:signal peptidase I
MAESITAETGEATPVQPRRLHPGLAFLAGVFGFGYLYVGRMGYAIVFVVAPYLLMLAASWTRLLVNPVAWYAVLPVFGLVWLVQLVHPVVLAWSRPLAPLKRYNRWWWYVAWIAGAYVASSLVAGYRGTAFGYEHYYIPAMSMAPALQVGDRIAVDTWRYRNVPPTFGDIVVCDFGDGTLVVKRVVGVPGDAIELRGARLVRNGRLIDESYLSSEQDTRLPDSPPLTLGAEEFFVLGDTRGNSFDSRQRGPLTRDQISGRVEFIYFSSSGGRLNWERFPVMLASD